MESVVYRLAAGHSGHKALAMLVFGGRVFVCVPPLGRNTRSLELYLDCLHCYLFPLLSCFSLMQRNGFVCFNILLSQALSIDIVPK